MAPYYRAEYSIRLQDFNRLGNFGGRLNWMFVSTATRFSKYLLANRATPKYSINGIGGLRFDFDLLLLEGEELPISYLILLYAEMMLEIK